MCLEMKASESIQRGPGMGGTIIIFKANTVDTVKPSEQALLLSTTVKQSTNAYSLILLHWPNKQSRVLAKSDLLRRHLLLLITPTLFGGGGENPGWRCLNISPNE